MNYKKKNRKKCYAFSFSLSCLFFFILFVPLSSSFESEIESGKNDEIVAYDESTNQTSKVNYRMIQLCYGYITMLLIRVISGTYVRCFHHC